MSVTEGVICYHGHYRYTGGGIAAWVCHCQRHIVRAKILEIEIRSRSSQRQRIS